MNQVEELSARIRRISETKQTVVRRAQDFSYGFAHTKPTETAFSATEIIYHLADVELLWQSRIDILLRDGKAVFTQFDPDQAARDKNYNVQPFRDGIALFERNRERTIEQYGNLTEEQLKFSGQHPKFGSVTVLDILEIMANHDLGHVEQFSRTEASVKRE